MTDDPTLAALDERGRAAAAGVRSALADRPVPAFEPDLVRIDVDASHARTARSRPVVGLLAAAAAVLVVVAAVVALAGPGEDDSAPADEAPGELRRYVLADVPEGYGVAQVLDVTSVIPDGTGFGAVGPASVYGSEARLPGLTAIVWDESDDGGGPSTAEGGAAIEVPGRRAWSVTDLFGVADAVLVDAGDAFVALFGSAGQDVIVAAAAEVGVSGDRATVPSSGLPAGWTRLGEIPAANLGPGYSVLGPLGPSWGVSYVGGADGEEGILVRSLPGSVLTVQALRLTTADVAEREVRGHDALVARVVLAGSSAAVTTVRWEERPGEVVEVSSGVLPEDELVAQAEDLEVIGADGVEGLRRQALEVGVDAPAAGVVGRGRFSGGADWVLVHDVPGEEPVTLRTTAEEVVSGSHTSGEDPDAPTSGDDPLGGSVGYGQGAELGWAYGLIGDGVVEVRVRDRDGADQPVTIVEGDGLRGWVAEVAPGGGTDIGAHEVQAIGADGRVLQTIDIGS